MLAKKECASSNDTNSIAILNARFSLASWLVRSLGLVAILTIVGSTLSLPAKAGDDVGETAFKSNCVICHGADGSGTPTGKSLKAPDLRSDAVQKLTDAQIETQISEGKNNMPPFKNTLTKDQIKALVAYVHALGKKK